MPDVARFLEALTKCFHAKNDKELAGHIGISTGKLSEWRSLKLGVTLKAIRKISERTGLAQSALLDQLDGPPGPRPALQRPLVDPGLRGKLDARAAVMREQLGAAQERNAARGTAAAGKRRARRKKPQAPRHRKHGAA